MFRFLFVQKIIDLDENMRTFKADQEKCKGNEAFNAGSYEEALVYYTRSIQYLPNSASYNNRALACLSLLFGRIQKLLNLTLIQFKKIFRFKTRKVGQSY